MAKVAQKKTPTRLYQKGVICGYKRARKSQYQTPRARISSIVTCTCVRRENAPLAS